MAATNLKSCSAFFLAFGLALTVRADVRNGDFSAGLASWIVYSPGGPVVSGNVGTIDIDGPGGLHGPSSAFYCQPGIGDQRGIRQDLQLKAGVNYDLTANLAMDPGSNNADGGTVLAYLGSDQVYSVLFGETTFGVQEYATINASYTPVVSGTYTLAIEFYRGYFAGGGTPVIYLDNVRLVPEASTFALAAGFVGCLLFHRT